MLDYYTLSCFPFLDFKFGIRAKVFQPVLFKLTASNDVEIRVKGAPHLYFFIIEAITVGKTMRFREHQNIRNYKLS